MQKHKYVSSGSTKYLSESKPHKSIYQETDVIWIEFSSFGNISPKTSDLFKVSDGSSFRFYMVIEISMKEEFRCSQNLKILMFNVCLKFKT